MRQPARRFAVYLKKLLLTVIVGTLLLPMASAQVITLRGQLRDQVASLRGSQSASAWESWKALHGWSALEAQLRPEGKIDPAAIETVRQKILSAKTLDARALAIVDTLQALAETAQPLADEQRAEYLTKLESQLVPVSDADLAAARARLKKSLAALEPKLLAYADRGKAWKTYLFWDETQQLLNESAPPREVLRKLEARWSVAPLAWDLTQIRDCGNEVQAVSVLLRRDPETIKQTAALFAAAKDTLSKPLQPAELGAALPLLSTLAELDLGARLLLEVRDTNAPAMATVKMLPAFFGDKTPVQQTFPVRGNYGGSYATGQGQVNGTRTTKLIPDPAAARFEVNFHGINTSQTTSSTQGVRVNSSAASQVYASKDFTFRPTGISSSPATASAATNLQYTGIGVSRRFFQDEARRRAQATRGSSQRNTQQAVELGARESLDTEGAKLSADFDKSYQRDVLRPLYRQSSFQPRIATNSTKDAAQWQLTLLRPHEVLQLPPVPELASTMLQTTAHQTFPAREFEMRLGGKALDQNNWREVLGKQLAERLSQNEAEDDGSEWSILMPAEVPCEYDFSENNIVRVKFRLANFKNEDFEQEHIDLKLKFESTVVDGKWVLKRLEQPEVQFIADPATGKYVEQISGRELSLRALLRRRLAKLLGEEMVLTPRDLGFAPHNGRELEFAEIVCRDEWLVMNMK